MWHSPMWHSLLWHSLLWHSPYDIHPCDIHPCDNHPCDIHPCDIHPHDTHAAVTTNTWQLSQSEAKKLGQGMTIFFFYVKNHCNFSVFCGLQVRTPPTWDICQPQNHGNKLLRLDGVSGRWWAIHTRNHLIFSIYSQASNSSLLWISPGF